MDKTSNGNKRKKEVTIYDLAEELGLSASTISRALRDHDSVGLKTRKAVNKLAKELGYRRNSMAANLRKQESNTIGVLVSWISQPFQSNVISGIEEVAKKAGYNVIISQSRDSFQLEKENLRTLYDSRVCGLIVSLAMESQSFDHFDLLNDTDTPIVFVDRTPNDISYQRVIIDNYSAGYKAAMHLIEQGCTRIGHVGGAQHQSIYNKRQVGYIDALKANGLAFSDAFIINGDELSQKDGIQLTKELLDRQLSLDGLFIANDQAAAAAASYLKRIGVQIPQDVAIIGFNDDPICTLIDPPLSSITHPATEMGRIAAQRVLKIKNFDDRIAQTITLGTEVVARTSSLRR